MEIYVEPATYATIEPLRELYREEARCQIRYDSILRRGMADPYIIRVDSAVAGYSGVWNTTDSVGRVMEFYTLPSVRRESLPIFREVLRVSAATGIEAQTNISLLTLMLYDCSMHITSDVVMFDDYQTTQLACTDAIFRKAVPADESRIFEHHAEPVGDWLIEVNGEIAATGGILFHYNPPYGDIYMEVAEQYRNRGYGSFLVQELKRICYEIGKKPAARCGTDNLASRATLQRAGFMPCARVLVGKVA